MIHHSNHYHLGSIGQDLLEKIIKRLKKFSLKCVYHVISTIGYPKYEYTHGQPNQYTKYGYGLGMGWKKMGNFGLGTKESKVLGSISQDLWEKISTNN